MMTPILGRLWLLPLALGLCACKASDSLRIVWPAAPAGRAELQLVGLEPELLARLEAGESMMDALAVYVNIEGNPPPMAGSYRLQEGTLYFRPNFDWTPNLSYAARSLASGAGPIEVTHTFYAEELQPSTLVSGIYPSAPELPDNLLRLYLHFSAPMRRGQAYDCVRILDANGDEVYEPFIPFSQELWDPTSTRLTLLLDPGRIKRGLVPNQVFGAPLDPGQSYTLVVDSSWRDARGVGLAASFEHSFVTTDSDRMQPNLRRWQLDAPLAGTRAPLRLGFPEALDHAQLKRMIKVHTKGGQGLEGQISIGQHERSWEFRPRQAWKSGEHELRINPLLEDLAGNSFARAFEMDLNFSSEPVSSTQPLLMAFLIAER